MQESRECRILSQERRGPRAVGSCQPAGMHADLKQFGSKCAQVGWQEEREEEERCVLTKDSFEMNTSLLAHTCESPKARSPPCPWSIPPAENIISKPGLLSCQLCYDLTSKGRTFFQGTKAFCMSFLFSLFPS